MKEANDESLEWTLVRRSLMEELTGEEQQQLNTWLNASPAHQAYYDRISGFNPAEGLPGLSKEQYERDFIRYVSLIRQAKRQQKRRRLVYFTRYAAVFVVLLAVGVYFWYQGTSVSETPVTSLPLAVQGKPQPILVTEEGARVLLDEQGRSLQQISHGRISSGKHGIVYNNISQGTTSAVVGHHTLIIPRGGEYRVELADGTIVWLNSETEFSYPVSFADSTREVTLKGEAYFNVVKNSDAAFLVQVDEFTVKVYGTEFNVNAYEADRVETVLTQGSVSMRCGDEEVMLKPNQKGAYFKSDGAMRVEDVNVLSYVAWKNGDFIFKDESLESIMNKLARWYDLDVFYQNKELKEIRLSGNLKRYKDVQDLFNAFEKISEARIKVDGRTVVVSK